MLARLNPFWLGVVCGFGGGRPGRCWAGSGQVLDGLLGMGACSEIGGHECLDAGGVSLALIQRSAVHLVHVRERDLPIEESLYGHFVGGIEDACGIPAGPNTFMPEL